MAGTDKEIIDYVKKYDDAVGKRLLRIIERLAAASIAFLPGYSDRGQGSPTAWRCRLCEQFGFAGAQSVKHKDDCPLGGI